MPPQQRRASIIAAARSLLTSTGVTFTTREVAEAAGIAEGTIFRHFATKDDLVQAIIDDVLDPAGLCADIDALPSTLDLPERVEHSLQLMRSHLSAITEVMTALHPHRAPADRRTGRGPHRARGPRPDDPHHRPDDPHRGVRTWYATVTASLTRVLEPYADQLRLPVDQACALLMSAVTVNMRPAAVPDHQFSAGELADILLNGIASHPSPSPQESSCS